MRLGGGMYLTEGKRGNLKRVETTYADFHRQRGLQGREATVRKPTFGVSRTIVDKCDPFLA